MDNHPETLEPAAQELVIGNHYLFVSKLYGIAVGKFCGLTRLGRLKFVDTAYLAKLEPRPMRLYAAEVIDIEPWRQIILPRQFEEIEEIDPETIVPKRLHIQKEGV